MHFRPVDHETWRRLHAGLARSRAEQADPAFADGLARRGIAGAGIPALEEVNARLEALTGWRGVVVDGFVTPRGFFAMLARREFPVGGFMRDAADLDYTPAPDVFHDLYGHLPLLVDPAYADFCRRFGELGAAPDLTDEQVAKLDRLFWFGVEFPLLETPAGRRIFGGGILSSRRECDHALGAGPRVLPFDVATILQTPFHIDRLQDVLFVLSSKDQLYGSLAGLTKAL